MKKIFFIAALFIGVASVSSCTKENDAKPTVNKTLADGPGDKSLLGSGDGTRPSQGG